MMIKKILDFYNNHSFFGYIFIVIFSMAFFGIIQASASFADPDAFYHAKMAILMAKQGIVHNFPWLAYTALPQIYTDHHFLYHVILIPFIWKLPPLIGIKIAACFINTVFVVLFYYFLRKNGTRWPLFFVFLLLGAAPFIFRIDLAKANGLSLIFVMLILLAIFRTPSSSPPLKRPLARLLDNKRTLFSRLGEGRGWGWLVFLSFLYVWSYGGWPMGIFLAAIYFLASVSANFIIDSGKKEKLFHGFIVSLLREADWRPLAATIIGSLAGLIVNPYFPQNLKFYWVQIVQIALVNYQSKIGVGMEWYKFDLAELVSYSGLVILVFIFGMMFFFGKIFIAPPSSPSFQGEKEGVSRETIKNIFFFVFAAGAFFILTLKSCRNAEYFFPFAIMAAAFILKYFWDENLYSRFKKNILSVFKKEFFYRVFIIYLFMAFILNFGISFWKIKLELARGFSFDYHKEAMEAAQKNSQPGDIIFHSDWDDWPMLFYHNDYNRYIVGLDATFMYKYNSEFFKKWRDITWGDFKGDPYGIIKNDFHATIIFIAKNDINIMDKYFKDDGRFELLFDKEGKVYKIR